LINAVLERTSNKLCRKSKVAGATRTLNFYGPSSTSGQDRHFYLVDAPGYGDRGRPEWGKLLMDYMSQRSNLRRVFVLVAISHGLKESDQIMFQDLHELTLQSAANRERTYPFSYQVVFTKGDLSAPGKPIAQLAEEIWKIAPTCMPKPLLTSTSIKASSGGRFGLDELRLSISEVARVF